MRARIEDLALTQRGALFGWVPVCLGIGIGVYFTLPQEPGLYLFSILALAGCLICILWRRVNVAFAPLFLGLLIALAGFSTAKYRAEAVAAPVLSFRYYGPIQGRVVNIDRSASDAIRLTLDSVVLARMSPERTPARVRVSLHGDQPFSMFRPGEALIMTGHLSPPAGPAEPGGFDFQRHAWFLQLGAVGYTRTPVLRLATPARQSPAMRIFAMRMAISHAVRAALPGEVGGFAAAIMTGDRSGIGQGTLADLRAANLAHLLAISGLHMGLLTGFIFAVVRYGLVLLPGIGLHWPVKKIAAVCALSVGAFYLALSGGNVATERAFIMVAVMFVAVLLDRRALTLRAVAMAAILVLLWQPQALMGPGFQMSFAATTALVAVFGALRRFDLGRLPRWSRPVLSVVLSSFVAGLATAPFAAAHFNQIAHYGLIANVLSVPLMGVLVMPAAVLAACLAPLGLWEIGLSLMHLGLRWILWVAGTVATQDGALSHVPAPDWRVLPMLALGLLWVVLIRGRVRLAGLAGVLAAALMWQHTARPLYLVSDNGALVGLLGDKGRALSTPTGSSFVAGIWLENDGAPVPQAEAAARQTFDTDGRQTWAALGSYGILHVSGKTALAALQGCGGAQVLISNQIDDLPRPCLVYDLGALRNTGALAIDLNVAGDLVITSARGLAGDRLWNKRQAATAATVTLPVADTKKGRRSDPIAGKPCRSVSADQPDQTALHLDLIVAEHACLIGRVRRL